VPAPKPFDIEPYSSRLAMLYLRLGTDPHARVDCVLYHTPGGGVTRFCTHSYDGMDRRATNILTLLNEVVST